MVRLLLMELELGMLSNIDINFDFRSDTPPGKDPDSFSPTIRLYLKFLEQVITK